MRTAPCLGARLAVSWPPPRLYRVYVAGVHRPCLGHVMADGRCAAGRLLEVVSSTGPHRVVVPPVVSQAPPCCVVARTHVLECRVIALWRPHAVVSQRCVAHARCLVTGPPVTIHTLYPNTNPCRAPYRTRCSACRSSLASCRRVLLRCIVAPSTGQPCHRAFWPCRNVLLRANPAV